MNDKPVCPVCEDEMNLRYSKYGAFYGCCSYPACRGTLTIEQVRNMPKEKIRMNKYVAKEDYEKYLHSNAWRRLKERFKRSQRYTGKCYICGTTRNIHFHHRTYKRLGNERLSDITLLCKRHHERVHELLEENTNTRINLWNIISKLKLREKYRRNGYI